MQTDQISNVLKKYGTKHKLYKALVFGSKKGTFIINFFFFVTVHLHLPKESSCSLRFLQSLLTGTKRAFKLDEVTVVAVPSFPELSIKAIYEMMANDKEVMMMLPDIVDIKRINRDFVWRIVYNMRDNWAKKVVHAATQQRAQIAIDLA